MSMPLGAAIPQAFRFAPQSAGDGTGSAELRALMLLAKVWSYAFTHPAELGLAVRQHVALCAAALAVAALLGLPLGVWTSRSEAGRSVVAIVTALRVVPSLAVLAFMLPLLGLGFWPALVALALLGFPPILINTDVALRGVAAPVREAARGMGMRPGQLLARVEAPLAAPVVIAGLRTSAIEVIASATLAAFIGAGGLGTFILDGLANNDMRQLLLGGASVAILALAADAFASALLALSARRIGYGSGVAR